jgi:GST-like protein
MTKFYFYSADVYHSEDSRWQLQSQDLALFPALSRWFVSIAARPGTVRAYARAEAFRAAPVVSEESRKVLFGQSAHTVR